MYLVIIISLLPIVFALWGAYIIYRRQRNYRSTVHFFKDPAGPDIVYSADFDQMLMTTRAIKDNEWLIRSEWDLQDTIVGLKLRRVVAWANMEGKEFPLVRSGLVVAKLAVLQKLFGEVLGEKVMRELEASLVWHRPKLDLRKFLEKEYKIYRKKRE